jgi:hypothetical protein
MVVTRHFEGFSVVFGALEACLVGSWELGAGCGGEVQCGDAMRSARLRDRREGLALVFVDSTRHHNFTTLLS